METVAEYDPNTDADRPQDSGEATAGRMQAYRARGNNISIGKFEMSDRRKACALDPIIHLTTYHPHWFTAPFSQDQIDSIMDMEKLCREGFDFFDVEPRGWGKTTRAKGMVIRAVLHGFQRYIPLVGATSTQAKKLCQEVEQELADNDLLAEDWPDICLPIRDAFAKPNRSRYLQVNKEPARLECSSLKLVLPGVRCCTDGPDIYNSVFECAGLQEACRGLRHTTSSGKILRPGVVLIDDFQTDRSSRSPGQCSLRIDLIRNAFKRMGGFNKKVRVGIIATVITQGDAADQLLDRSKHPDLHGVRKKFIYDWPIRSRYGMEQRKLTYNESDDLWGKYVNLRRQSKREGSNGEPANELYIANRAPMDEGGRAGWDHGFDTSEGELSTIQSAFNIIADDGEASFFAECQNEPIKVTSVQIKLTADHIMSNVNGLEPGEVNPSAHHLLGFVDWNDHCLAWCVGAFRRDLGGDIVAYGEWGREGNCPTAQLGNVDRPDRVWDRKSPPAGEKITQAFWTAQDNLARWLFAPGRWTRQGRTVPLELILIDDGYRLEKGDRTLIEWCYSYAKRGGYGIMPCRGWSAQNFSLRANLDNMVKISYESWWRVDKDRYNPEVKTLSFDAQFHRRQMQLAWLRPTGSPESLSINGKSGIEHMKFAQQVASEKLLEYQLSERNVSGLYTYQVTPGIRPDLGDCVSGVRMGAWTMLGDSGKVSILGQGAASSAAPAVLDPVAPSPVIKPAPVPAVRRGPIVIPPDQSGWNNWGHR